MYAHAYSCDVIPLLSGGSGWVVSRYLWIAVFYVFAIPLVRMTTFDKLRNTSCLAMICFLYILVLSHVYAYRSDVKSDLNGSDKDYSDKKVHKSPQSILDALSVVPIIILSLNCHENV